MSNIPADLKYAKSHEWVRITGDIATVGITDHAQHELTDVVFVELPQPGRKIKAGEAWGFDYFAAHYDKGTALWLLLRWRRREGEPLVDAETARLMKNEGLRILVHGHDAQSTGKQTVIDDNGILVVNTDTALCKAHEKHNPRCNWAYTGLNESSGEFFVKNQIEGRRHIVDVSGKLLRHERRRA